MSKGSQRIISALPELKYEINFRMSKGSQRIMSALPELKHMIKDKKIRRGRKDQELERAASGSSRYCQN